MPTARKWPGYVLTGALGENDRDPTSRGYPDNLGMENPDHRWQEYDELDDDYSRLLLDELLPEVRRQWAFTDDPARRAMHQHPFARLDPRTADQRDPGGQIGDRIGRRFFPRQPLGLGAQRRVDFAGFMVHALTAPDRLATIDHSIARRAARLARGWTGGGRSE